MPSVSSALERATAWLRDDADPDDRADLERLLAVARAGDSAAVRELEDRFRGPLEFGTAGLRGVVGAGEHRFNRSVVLRTTHGLAAYLKVVVPGAAERGVVIGHDARPKSEEMAVAVAEVLAAQGIVAHLLLGPSPTPLVAFGVSELRAAGGVVITASHNPPEYNGYKVYLDDGAQIGPPHDRGIAEHIHVAPPASSVPRVGLAAGRASGMIRDARIIERSYVRQVLELRRLPVVPERLRIAYTPLHGVGARLTREVLEQAGYRDVHVVPEQAEPDGRFPTVRFPNPEEPGALDRVLALAERVDADLVVAQDPDADRLAAAGRDRNGRWQVLTGNELGVLLAHHVLTREGTPDPRSLVITTIVSSAQLGRIARDLGVSYAESLTGFKWLARTGRELEAQKGARVTFCYEEALGYSVGTVVRDKDGISALLVLAELAAEAKAQGKTILDRLRELRERFGFYVSRQKSVVLPGREGADRIRAAMAQLHRGPLASLGSVPVECTWDLERRCRDHRDGKSERVDHLPAADVVVFELADGSRAAVRPSGTEPKIKLYLEAVEVLSQGEALEGAQSRAESRLNALETALLSKLDLGVA